MARDDSLLRVVLLVLLAILALPLVLGLVMVPTMGMFGGGHMWNGTPPGGTGWWLSMLLVMAIPLLVLLLIGYVIYRAIAGEPTGRTDPAIQQLREAYARGEVSDEEFERRLERLEESH